MAEVSIPNQNAVVYKMPRLVKVFILRRGVVFTSEVGMTHVNRRWKAYPARNKDK